MLDWTTWDDEVQRAVARFRQACQQLHGAPAPAHAANPLPSWLVDEERRAELDERSDGLAPAVRRWVQALAAEHRLWAARVDLQTRWREPHLLAELGEPRSARQLRAAWLSRDGRRDRQVHAAALARIAARLTDAQASFVDRRIDAQEGTPLLHVAEADAGDVAAAASALLRRTDDAAQEHQRRGWVEGIAGTLGRDAGEGWPARPHARWLGDVFGRGDITNVVALEHLAAGPLWGGSSFARALGWFGVAALDAGRPADLPWCAHQDPWGARRHLRRALFAALPLEPSFARQVLGLGRDRTRAHQRAMAAALLGSLRIDALRVLLAAAWPQGRAAVRDRFDELTEGLFGAAAPPALLAVLPQLRPADGASFVGSLFAVEARDHLVGRFDEDWFRNPAASSWLREQDALARRPVSLDEKDLQRAVAAVGRRADELLA